MRAVLRVLRLAPVLVLLAGCAGTNAAPIVPGAGATISAAGRPSVYVAIGASETVGVGSDNPASEAWPQVFYVSALSRAAVAYNLGVSGSIASRAVTEQLPAALALHPSVATVFLGTNDVLHGENVADFESAVEAIVGQLRRAGATVLVADIPVLHGLPLVQACAGGDQGGCPPNLSAQIQLSSLAELDQRVDTFNAAIKRVAARDGAVLVDLFARGDPVALDPALVSGDGFHPSDSGHRAIAEAFVAALRSSRVAIG